MSAEDDMQVLAPLKREVVYHGEVIEVTPVTMRELQAFAAAAQPLLSVLRSVLVAGDGDEGMALLTEAAAEHADDLVRLVALGVRRPVAQIAAGSNLGAVYMMLFAVIEVNRDFFGLSLRRLLRTQPPQADGAGPMPSTSSSAPVTP